MLLSQAQGAQNEHHNDNQTDEIDDAVHGAASSGVRGRTVRTRTLALLKNTKEPALFRSLPNTFVPKSPVALLGAPKARKK